MLTDAISLFENHRLKSVADRAYYVMFHAAQAGLVASRIGPARTHRGLRSQFGRHLVNTGKIEKDYAKDLAMAQDVRQQSTYEAFAAITDDGVAELIERAERFLNRVKALLGGSQA